MSGIVGMVRFDGEVSTSLVQNLTRSLQFRGPDDTRTWTSGSVGLGTTLLKTTLEDEHEYQPYGFDNRLWIAADVRLDGRDELVAELAGAGCNGLSSAADSLLVLRAYNIWGENCVRHLIGDFAFVIWDAADQKLFCARDHIGIKLLFYASVGNGLIVSNTLNCVRSHPLVPDDLNELAICEFLLFGEFCESTTTAFAHIHRLAPGHCMTFTPQGARIRRYWEPSVGAEPLRVSKQECTEGFRAVLKKAVRDRLRAHRAAIQLSGGLDSSAVAATLKDIGNPQLELHGFCTYYEHLIPDNERHYVNEISRVLNLPVHYISLDDFELFEGHRDPATWVTPEPDWHVFLGARLAVFRAMSQQARIFFTGHDGDAILGFEDGAHFQRRIVRGEFATLFRDSVEYMRYAHRVPPFGLRGIFKRWRKPPMPFPTWINPDLSQKYSLEERWCEWLAMTAPQPNGSDRPDTYAAITSPSLHFMMESQDPGVTGVCIEGRHPLLDSRVIQYALNLAPVPWCVRKCLIREAFRGILPPSVSARPKTTLLGDPAAVLVSRLSSEATAQLPHISQVDAFVVRNRVPSFGKSCSLPWGLWTAMRPMLLNFWLGRRDTRKIRNEE